MRNFAKITRILIIYIMLLTAASVFVSCSNSTESETGDTTTDSDSQTDYIYIVKDGITDYYVIRSDFADDANIDAAVNLRIAIGEATGVEPGITTDWEKNPVYEHELIVGETLREENGLTIDRISLGKTGYIIKEVNGKIYIAGGEDVGTTLACEYFIDTFVKEGQDVKVPVGYEYIVYHQYDIPALYIDMNRVDVSYSIVIPIGSGSEVKEAAERLRDALYEKTGVYLEISEGNSETQKAFVLSGDKPDITGIYSIKINGSSMVFESSASSGVAGCVDNFIELYLNGKYGKYNFPADYEYYDLGDYFIISYPDTAEK